VDWFAVVLEHHDLEVLPLDLEVCLRSTELPAIHADPCDRMIIAAAQVHRFPVVTTDLIFSQYGIEMISCGPYGAGSNGDTG
jgi:PIN domain nuclease of toxin-antitoxin system